MDYDRAAIARQWLSEISSRWTEGETSFVEDCQLFEAFFSSADVSVSCCLLKGPCQSLHDKHAKSFDSVESA